MYQKRNLLKKKTVNSELVQMVNAINSIDGINLVTKSWPQHKNAIN